MEKLRQAVDDDLGVGKIVKLQESTLHKFIFEANKTEADKGMRDSQQ